MDVIEYLLPPEERKVVFALAEHGGEMRQSELVALSGLSKVKIHRILKRMEQRGLVEVIPVGRYNIVKLNKYIAEVFRERFTNFNGQFHHIIIEWVIAW